jgi:hypothetical protein
MNLVAINIARAMATAVQELLIEVNIAVRASFDMAIPNGAISKFPQKSSGSIKNPPIT